MNSRLPNGGALTYLGIPLLDWTKYDSVAPVQAAYRDTVASTTKAICLHSLALTKGTKNAFHYATGASHHIFIEPGSEFEHHAIVHELGHTLFAEQGFERIVGPLAIWAQEILSNDLQHLYVFPQMEECGLDMTDYWKDWERKLLDSARQIGSMVDDPFASYMHFPRIFSWFFLPHISGPALEEYGKLNPALVDAASAACKAAKRFGFHSIEANRQCLEVLHEHWTAFCDTLFPMDQIGREWVRKVRACYLKPLRESIGNKPAEDIFQDLRQYGLVRPSR